MTLKMVLNTIRRHELRRSVARSHILPFQPFPRLFQTGGQAHPPSRPCSTNRPSLLLPRRLPSRSHVPPGPWNAPQDQPMKRYTEWHSAIRVQALAKTSARPREVWTDWKMGQVYLRFIGLVIFFTQARATAASKVKTIASTVQAIAGNEVVQEIGSAVIKGVPLLMKALEELSKAHPFAQGERRVLFIFLLLINSSSGVLAFQVCVRTGAEAS